MYDDFIDQDPENITWNYVSEYALCTKNYKTCLFLILALLETEHGLNDHRKALLRLKPQLISISQNRSFNWKSLFCSDQIENTYIYNTTSQNAKDSNVVNHTVLYLPYKNKYLQEEFFQFCITVIKKPNLNLSNFQRFFEESFQDASPTIRSYKYFTDMTFWTQATYFKNCSDLSKKETNICLRLLTQFYRYLVNRYTEHNYFSNSLHLSEALLFSPSFVKSFATGCKTQRHKL